MLFRIGEFVLFLFRVPFSRVTWLLFIMFNIVYILRGAVVVCLVRLIVIVFVGGGVGEGVFVSVGMCMGMWVGVCMGGGVGDEV